MKPYLPYNLLLAVTILVTGFVVLYNFVLRDSYATTLHYSYPVVEPVQTAELPVPERITPAGEEEEAAQPENQEEAVQQEEPAITRVQFPLDVNTATVDELKFIPQVGDVMSQRIVQYRDVLGGYTDLEQLMEIKGVGEKTYQHLYTYLMISGGDGIPELEDGEEASSEEPEEEEESSGPDNGDVVNAYNLYYEDEDDEDGEDE